MAERSTPTTCPGIAALALALCACGQPAAQGAGAGELTVFAAASLTEAFGALERGFEGEHPELDVRLSFAGSQVLRLQIEQGATADVFASADEQHVRALVEGGHARPSQPLARGELVVIVPGDDRAGIERFAQLPQAARIVVGSPRVPVGIYARQVLQRAGEQLGAPWASAVRSRIVSEESNARLVRAKVELGEADAALVYRSDVAGARGVRAVPIPPALNVRARYRIAALTRARRPPAARAFIDYARSERGRAILERFGFIADDARLHGPAEEPR